MTARGHLVNTIGQALTDQRSNYILRKLSIWVNAGLGKDVCKLQLRRLLLIAPNIFSVIKFRT